MSGTVTQTTGEIVPYSLYIDGQLLPSTAGQTYESLNPYTGAPWARIADASPADVDHAVAAARDAFHTWGKTTPTYRGKILRRLGELIERDADRLARIETQDNGKLLRETSGQVRNLPDWYDYYAGLADKFEGSVIPVDKPNFLVYTRHEPVGIVGAITPWNSPLLLLTWKLAPALAAGCTVVVKPSDHTPASTIEFVKLCTEAGVPDGVVNVVTGQGPATGEALSKHPGVDKLAFTGSTATGRAVAHAAADTLARTTLELGGKSAQIVFADADLEAAANGVVAGVFAAAGQTCMAGSRLIVHESVQEPLVERIIERARRIVLGDPMAPETEMGPLATDEQLHKMLSHLAQAREEGATVAYGGEQNEELGGYFVKPTVLTNMTRKMRTMQEEIFGPVLAVTTFTDEDDAITQANDTEFGLAGSVWTKDIHRAHRMAAAIRAGTVWINAYRVVGPHVPFGGYGASGVGRENGIGAIREYTETKAVWVELSGATRDPFILG